MTTLMPEILDKILIPLSMEFSWSPILSQEEWEKLPSLEQMVRLARARFLRQLQDDLGGEGWSHYNSIYGRNFLIGLRDH